MRRPRIHIMGVGGSGASAVCGIAHGFGYQVSGCDQNKDSEYLESLKSQYTSMPVYWSHDPKHLEKVDLLAASPAILKFDPKNSEICEARKKKIPVISWQEFMGKFLHRGKFVIAVAGTHGKSTTTAMVGHILEDAGLDPTVEIGAVDRMWQSNYRIGKSKFFVCEADEYNNNFLNYHPDTLIITNVEWDHPDFFKNKDSLYRSFANFISQAGRPLSLFVPPKGIGIKEFRSYLLGQKKTRKFIELIKHPEIQKLKLQIPGEFNILNANLAAAVGRDLKIEEKIIKISLENFLGLSRRLEFMGTINGVNVFDDFAHHPTEIEVTLSTLKKQFPQKRICVIFQPHTFSRTKALFSDFVEVFQKAKMAKIIITDIFASREKEDLRVTSHDLAADIGQNTIYISSLEGAADWINKNFSRFDVIVTIGAGDIGKIWDFVLLRLKLIQ